MARADEVKAMRTEAVNEWLAGQLDELESKFLERIKKLTDELTATRRVLTGILVAIVTAAVTIPLGLVWAAAIR